MTSKIAFENYDNRIHDETIRGMNYLLVASFRTISGTQKTLKLTFSSSAKELIAV